MSPTPTAGDGTEKILFEKKEEAEIIVGNG